MDRALGCMLGAFVGDAAGAVLEFQADIDKADVDLALTMPGGGAHRVGPGQITDDSELALCLAYGLLSDSWEAVAMHYNRWIQTAPFDIGNTCRVAFTHSKTAQAMTRAAARNNMASKANGALMRLSPAIVYGCRLPVSQLESVVKTDALLSHPNPTVLACNVCYAVAAAHLIRYKSDVKGAYAQAKLKCGWARQPRATYPTFACSKGSCGGASLWPSITCFAKAATLRQSGTHCPGLEIPTRTQRSLVVW